MSSDSTPRLIAPTPRLSRPPCCLLIVAVDTHILINFGVHTTARHGRSVPKQAISRISVVVAVTVRTRMQRAAIELHSKEMVIPVRYASWQHPYQSASTSTERNGFKIVRILFYGLGINSSKQKKTNLPLVRRWLIPNGGNEVSLCV